MIEKPGTRPTPEIEWIYSQALGIPIELDDDPTTANNQLPKHGDFGYRGNNLFMRLGDTIVKFAGTAV